MGYDANNWIQVRYDLELAFDNGVKGHPEDIMKTLGFKIIDGVPQSIGMCWWFTIEKDNNIIFPPYIKEIHYNFDYWHNHCYKDCLFFKKNPKCCVGGHSCVKEVK